MAREMHARFPNQADYEEAMKRWNKEHPAPAGTIHDLADHIDHIVRVAGIDHVGLGSDFDGVSMTPVQLEDVSKYPYITQELLDRGYTEREIHQVMSGNALRVLREAERVARRLKGQR